MPNVLFFTDDKPEITRLITRFAPPDFTVSLHSDFVSDQEKIELLKTADFLIPAGRDLPAPALRAAPRLKLVQLLSAGFDHINVALCRELGIPVANNGGGNAIDVAEHTIGLILGFYRRLFEMDHCARNQLWQPELFSLSALTIHGHTVGVVGVGKIGRNVVRLLNAFRAHVLYYDLVRLPAEQEQALGITYTPLPDLLRQSDIVTLHINLSPASRHLIGRAELALLKPTALLVNTCRGAVIDEAALIEVLTAKRILGAALDVLEQEPPAPDNPILQMRENVLLSPHAAGNSYDTWGRRGQFMFANMARVWAGEPPQAVVGN